MSTEDLHRRMDRLEERLARLESHLPMTDEPATPPVTPAPPPPPPRPPVAPAPAAPPTAPPTAPPEPAVPLASRLAAKRHAADESPADQADAPAPPRPSAPPPPSPWAPPTAAPSRRTTPFELVVGVKWMAWLGAFAVVMFVAFFLKLAYDRGWWSVVSPGARCLLGAGFGVLLIGGGELALRRISRPASVGLFGSGLSTLYLVCWAAFGYYEPALISREVAFVLMGVVAAAGFAVTWRTSFRTIGVLSILGGYATPILVGGGGRHPLELLTYLTMLLGVSLGLSAVRPRHFRTLRYVALGAQPIVVLVWLLNAGRGHWLEALVFMCLWWGMLLVECTWAALRRQSAAGNIVATVVSTALLVTAGTWVLASFAPPGGEAWLGGYTLAVAVLGAVVALQFGPGLDALRGVARTAMDKLAIALWAQSGVLLAVAVALQFDDYGQSVAWLAVALGAVEIGRRLPSRGVAWFGLVVGALAGARIALLDSWAAGGLTGELLALGAVRLTGWGLLAIFGVLATHVAAWRLGRAGPPASFKPWSAVPVLLAVAGTGGWLALTAAESTGLAIASLWLAGAVVLLALHGPGTRLGYGPIGLLALGAAAGRWLLVDAATGRVATGWDPAATLPLLNGQMALAAAIAATALLARRLAAPDRPEVGAPLVVAAAVTFLLTALSFEVDHALGRWVDPDRSPYPAIMLRSLGWTALWGAGGLALVVGGAARRVRPLVTAGLLFVLTAAAAWLSVDTLLPRLARGTLDVTPVANAVFWVGVALAVMLGWSWRTLLAAGREGWIPPGTARRDGLVSGAMLGAIGLWAGSLEIDRFFIGQPMSTQTGLSVWWGVYAVLLVLLGFARRTPAVRYVGLGLFAVTAIKVFLVDLREVDQVWRVVSFGALGALLTGTSIVYSRWAARIGGQPE
ncbi:MAG: DUF2339 domain-containing protein [Planctomycetota bacterium]|jgi:uncharacterized membrane protein